MALRDLTVNLTGDVTLYFDEGNEAQVRIDPGMAAQIVSAALQAYMRVLAPGLENLETVVASRAAQQAPRMSPQEILRNMPAPPETPRAEILTRVEEAVAKLRRVHLVAKSVINWEGDALVVTLTNMQGEPTGLKLMPRYMNDAGVNGFIEMLGEVATATPERLEDDL